MCLTTGEVLLHMIRVTENEMSASQLVVNGLDMIAVLRRHYVTPTIHH